MKEKLIRCKIGAFPIKLAETTELALPKVLGATDIQDLNPKFKNRYTRFHGGRGNELLFQELQKNQEFHKPLHLFLATGL